MKIFYILILTLCYTITSHSQNYTIFENDMRVFNRDHKSVTQLTLTHYGEYNITKNIGVTDYVFVTDNNGYQMNPWGELLIGLFYKLCDKLLFGAYVGTETNKPNIRFAATGWWNITDKLNLSFFVEKSRISHGEYYDFHLKYNIFNTSKMCFFTCARFRQGYGIGIPLGVKYKLSEMDKVPKYLGLFYTTFYNLDMKELNTSSIVPTVSLNIEL